MKKLTIVLDNVGHKELKDYLLTLKGIKEVEVNVFKLPEYLIPLQSSYTQSSGNNVGRPSLPDDQKSDKTIANEISLDAQGGSE